MTIVTGDMQAAVSAVLREIGERVVMARFGRLDAAHIREKSSPSDLVTVVDEEAEAALRERLSAILPGAGFIGEEAAAADPSIVAKLEGPGLYWVVDPIDGTRNFVQGVEEFGSIVALVRDGETIGAWINAMPDRACYAAAGDQPVRRNGETVVVSEQADAGRPSGLRSIGWLTPDWRDRLLPGLRANVDTVAGHCSAYAYIRLVEGAVDFKLSSRIHPWDHAAGALFLRNAGGAVAFLDDGSDYRPLDSADRPLLAAAPGRDFGGIAARIIGD